MKNTWPILSFETAKSSYETLHLFTQIIGKIKVKKLPWVNHSWHVTFHLTATGLTTLNIPDKDQNFQIDFDLVNHQLIIVTSKGTSEHFSLKNISVSDFYTKVFEILNRLGIEIKINLIPNEIVNVISFDEDKTHCTYEEKHIEALHLALLQSHEVLSKFRSAFKGKCSPAHFFWGGFDLAVTRFSGRKAPKHPGGVPHLPDWIAQEAYSHEVISCGFWPGNDMIPYAVFYSYIYPEPVGYKTSKIKPAEAFYNNDFKEFILPYDAVQQSKDPEKTLLEFAESTYRAGANLAHWNKEFENGTYLYV